MSFMDVTEEWKHSSEYWEDRALKAEAERDRLRAAMELAERCHLEQATQWKAANDRLRADNADLREHLVKSF